jgi:hypothetical protein
VVSEDGLKIDGGYFEVESWDLTGNLLGLTASRLKHASIFRIS